MIPLTSGCKYEGTTQLGHTTVSSENAINISKKDSCFKSLGCHCIVFTYIHLCLLQTPLVESMDATSSSSRVRLSTHAARSSPVLSTCLQCADILLFTEPCCRVRFSPFLHRFQNSIVYKYCICNYYFLTQSKSHWNW